jgi:hypothetical protein
MKSLFVSIVAAVLLVGCGESQSSPPPAEVEPAEPVAIAPDISIWHAALKGNIEAVKQHIAAGTDVNAMSESGNTPLSLSVSFSGYVKGDFPVGVEIAELLIAAGADVNFRRFRSTFTPLDEAALFDRKEMAKLLIAKGADVNATDNLGHTPLNRAFFPEMKLLLRKHGGKTGEELK